MWEEIKKILEEYKELIMRYEEPGKHYINDNHFVEKIISVKETELIKVWNEYKNFLQEKYPVKEEQGGVNYFHQKIDTILKLQQKELIKELFDRENEDKEEEALKSFSDKFNPEPMAEDLMKSSNEVVDEILFDDQKEQEQHDPIMRQPDSQPEPMGAEEWLIDNYEETYQFLVDNSFEYPMCDIIEDYANYITTRSKWSEYDPSKPSHENPR